MVDLVINFMFLKMGAIISLLEIEPSRTLELSRALPLLSTRDGGKKGNSPVEKNLNRTHFSRVVT